MKSIYPLILAGGASSRLFPFNKILSDLTGNGKTLIQQAYARACLLTSKDHVYALAVADLVAPMSRQLTLSKDHFFIDPVRRGTWPALMWAMAHLRKENPDAVLAVITGDHIIPKFPAFKRAALRACRLATEKASVVMLGVAPDDEAPVWTGFGVFRVKGEVVTDFSEKPTLAQAQRMIRQGGWQWNSGMFFFRISTAEQALARYQPAMFAQYQKLCAAAAVKNMKAAQSLYAEFPAKIPHPADSSRLVDNTIDFAIMTPLVLNRRVPQALAVAGGLPRWTDLGQWDALSAIVKKKKGENILVGNVQFDAHTRRCILAADGGFRLEVRHLSDVVVSVSARGLLILKRADLPAIKQHVANAPPKKFLIVNGLPGTQIRRYGRRVVVSGAAFIR